MLCCLLQSFTCVVRRQVALVMTLVLRVQLHGGGFYLLQLWSLSKWILDAYMVTVS